MENTMKKLLSTRLLTLGLAAGAALLLVAAGQAGGSARPGGRALVAVKKTALGTILVDARGRTLYLFEKDRNGVSMCKGACASYWPPLTSRGTPRAGKGVRQSLLRLARAGNGARQVTYAGHPLYKFVGDKRAGQTAGEGLDNFGAEWYAVAANGHKVDRPQSGGGGSGGYGGSGGGW
jgi:predicted lipoprotein with Yx(FWY)xxD motif